MDVGIADPGQRVWGSQPYPEVGVALRLFSRPTLYSHPFCPSSGMLSSTLAPHIVLTTTKTSDMPSFTQTSDPTAVTMQDKLEWLYTCLAVPVGVRPFRTALVFQATYTLYAELSCAPLRSTSYMVTSELYIPLTP